LAKNEYLMRHNKVCAHLHHSICKALGIKMTDKWYTQTHTHTPNSVSEHEDERAMESRDIHRQKSYGKQARYNK